MSIVQLHEQIASTKRGLQWFEAGLKQHREMDEGDRFVDMNGELIEHYKATIQKLQKALAAYEAEAGSAWRP